MDLAKLIDVIDINSKLISEVTGIAKNVISKDPNALSNNIVEFTIKSHFGESMYDRVQNIYHNIIGTG